MIFETFGSVYGGGVWSGGSFSGSSCSMSFRTWLDSPHRKGYLCVVVHLNVPIVVQKSTDFTKN